MIRKIIFAAFALVLGARPFIALLAFPKEDIVYSIALLSLSLPLILLNAKSNLRKNNPLFLCGLILLSSLFLSMALSSNKENSLRQFYIYSAYMASFFAVFYLKFSLRKTLALSLLAGATCVSIYALQWFLGSSLPAFDYFNHPGHGWAFAKEFLSRGRAFIPFSLPTDLGGYLIIFIPLATALLFKKNKASDYFLGLSMKSMFALLALVSMSILLLCTQSLGAITSLFAASGIFALKDKRSIRYTEAIWIAIGVIFIILLSTLWLRNINPNLFNVPYFSFTNRILYWKHALGLIQEHPFLGLGLGNYPFFNSMWAHNTYLQFWVENGLFGFLALLAFVWASLNINWAKIDESDRWLFYGLWVGNLSFIIHNLIDTTLFLPEVSLQWWAIVAILAYGYHQEPKQEP